jgi:general secretion pathway protein K
MKPRSRMRGVAAITAILIVAVAASTATFMLAQQSALIDQAMLVTSRAQADLYADAGLDWARGVLAEDARRSAIDSLGEGWAQPIVGLPVERAMVAGAIEDEQGKFNLNNLAARNEIDVRIVKNILAAVGLAPELAEALRDWIDADDDVTGTGGAENAHYLALKRPYRTANQRIAQIEELHRVRGFDARAIERLRPHVTAVPGASSQRTPVNINTASDIVIAAILDGKVPRDTIAERIAARRTKPFASTEEIAQWAPKAEPRAINDFAVKSDFFSARVQVAQDDVHVALEALLQRNPQGGATAIVWRRALH